MASATAHQACSLLALSALHLARFGPQLVADMQEYAAQRLQWRHHRMHVCKSAAQVCIEIGSYFVHHDTTYQRKVGKSKCLPHVLMHNHHASTEWVS